MVMNLCGLTFPNIKETYMPPFILGARINKKNCIFTLQKQSLQL